MEGIKAVEVFASITTNT